MTNAFRKKLIGKGPLVTGGNVMDKTSETIPARKEFRHPMLGKKIDQNDASTVDRHRVRRAIKRAKTAK